MNTETIKETIQAVIDGLTPLAQKLQIPIEHLWMWSVKHNYAVAFSELAFFLFTLILFIPYYKFIKWGMGKDEGSLKSRFYFSEGALISNVLIGIILTIMMVASIIITFTDTIQRFVAPEWNTSNDLIEMVRGENYRN